MTFAASAPRRQLTPDQSPAQNQGSYSTPASATTFAAASADVTLSVTHNGNFKQGDTADTYSINVSNTGTGATHIKYQAEW